MELELTNGFWREVDDTFHVFHGVDMVSPFYTIGGVSDPKGRATPKQMLIYSGNDFQGYFPRKSHNVKLEATSRSLMIAWEKQRR